MQIPIHLFGVAAAFLTLFATSATIFRFRKIQAEYTRKFVHIGTGLLTLSFPFLLDSFAEVALLCGGFMLLLAASLRWNLLPSINRVERKTHGSLSYPLAVILCYGAMEQFGGEGFGALLWFYLPMLVLALADPAAAFAGKGPKTTRFRVGEGEKSLEGSLAFALVTGLVVLICAPLIAANGMSFALLLLSITTTTTLAEAYTPNGLDNLTIPGTVLVNLLIFNLL